MQYLSYVFRDDIFPPHWGDDVAGAEHWESQLKVLCREAAWLGRAPVFQRIAPLWRMHNFNVEVRAPFSRYLDTENIEVLRRPDSDGGPPRTLSLAAINDIELQSLNIPQYDILKLPAGTPVSAAQNRRFRLIVRKTTPKNTWRLQRAPLLREACALEPAPAETPTPEEEAEQLQINLQPSAAVRELAAEIIRRLPDRYCAVHIRRADRLDIPALRIWTSPEAVALRLKRAGVAPEAPLYLMSDESSRRWLRRLRRRRPFLSCADFPRLAELIRPPGRTIISCFSSNVKFCSMPRKKSSSRKRATNILGTTPNTCFRYSFPCMNSWLFIIRRKSSSAELERWCAEISATSLIRSPGRGAWRSAAR